ncbi:MAG: hypothetical protein FWC50_11280 [Planctomycetaceae bacterium]|nr:hypothetical protein [Planctomycetaceae bacterium]
MILTVFWICCINVVAKKSLVLKAPDRLIGKHEINIETKRTGKTLAGNQKTVSARGESVKNQEKESRISKTKSHFARENQKNVKAGQS